MAKAVVTRLELPAEAETEKFNPGRPPAPKHFTKDEADEWNAIVKKMPNGWFGRESWPMLEGLVGHVCSLRQIRIALRNIDTSHFSSSENRDTFTRLLHAQDRETKAIANLSVKMRLAQQSSYDVMASAAAKRKAVGGENPWDKE